MMKKRLINILIIALFVLPGCSKDSPLNELVSWTINFSSKHIKEGDTLDIVFKADIEKGWRLYSFDTDTSIGPTAINLKVEENSTVHLLGGLISREPYMVYDQDLNEVLSYFEDSVILRQTIIAEMDYIIVPGEIEYEVYNTKEDCYFVLKRDFTLESDIADSQKRENDLSGGTKSDFIAGSNSLWALFFISFLAGLAAILTPCVFPMIPMTVSFFMNNKQQKGNGRLQATLYGLSIIAIYSVIGTVVALTLGANFANFLSTHWLPNILFFLIFIVFAISFFGMFEITMPSWLVNKSVAKEEKGGIIGVFFMAFTLVLVSFSCTGPIVGAILVASAGGQVLMPIIGMFGFSLAFALPFTLFAFFPGWLSNLPKSGGWLSSVKVILGFLELALGLKFLSIADQTYHWGILDREVYLSIWIVIFIFIGFYLMGKFKFPHEKKLESVSVPRVLASILTFGFVIYLLPGMIGAPLKALSGYLPPQSTLDFDIHTIVRENRNGNGKYLDADKNTNAKYRDFLHLPHGLSGYFDYEEALAAAKEENKPIFVDFTGHGCVNCREMEANVWSDPRVLDILNKDYIILALYVDDKTKLPESEWYISDYNGKKIKTLGEKNADFQISRFKVNAQPYYVLLDTNENMLTNAKSYDLDVEHFIVFLEKGIKEFNK